MVTKKKTESLTEENNSEESIAQAPEKSKTPEEDIEIDIFSQQSFEQGKEEKKKITKKELEEKAAKLAAKFGEEIKTEEIKEKLEKDRQTLVPSEDYVKSGIYIGTKVITPHMRKYVYRRRNDGIAILDLRVIDKKLKDFMKEFVKYKPTDFIMVCKREAGWHAVKKFAEITGVRIFTKKYPAGILTNSRLPNFFETQMVFICDPWLDKNAMNDAKIVKKKVFGLCDTNNYTFHVDEFVPCNNKSDKSIGLVLYILAQEYVKEHKIDKEVKLSDFVEFDEQSQ